MIGTKHFYGVIIQKDSLNTMQSKDQGIYQQIMRRCF